MSASGKTREQAATALEQLIRLLRAQAWHGDAGRPMPPVQAGVLRLLADARQGLRAARMAEQLGITAASLSDTLKTMEAHGWIERSPDPRDGRARLLRLSRKGHAQAALKRQPGHGALGLLQVLEQADLAALLRCTQLLVGEAQRQGLATGLRTCMGCRFFRPFASDDAARPHLCGFTGQPFGDLELRADCAEQERAEPQDFAANRERFRQRIPLPAE